MKEYTRPVRGSLDGLITELIESGDSSIRIDEFLNTWFGEAVESPWVIFPAFDIALLPGSMFRIYLLPDGELRNLMGLNNSSNYSNGYELPVLLVNSKLTSELSHQLFNALDAIIDRYNLKFLGRTAYHIAIGEILSLCLIKKEFGRHLNGEFSIFKLASEKRHISSSNESSEDIWPEIPNREDFYLARKYSPMISLEEMLRNWGQRQREPMVQNKLGFWWKLSIPYRWYSYDDVLGWKEREDYGIRIPKLPADYRDVDFITNNPGIFKKLKDGVDSALRESVNISNDSTPRKELKVDSDVKDRLRLKPGQSFKHVGVSASVDDYAVLFYLPGKVKPVGVSFFDAGMADSRNHKPRKPWIVFRAIIENGCLMERAIEENPHYTKKQKDRTKSHKFQIKKMLCGLFGRSEDPFAEYEYRVGWRLKLYKHNRP